MTYAIKEIYYTIQGEGAKAGKPAVFCRFAGCNLWSGLESARNSARCSFCDTDFVGTDGPGGGEFETADQVADVISSLWPSNNSHVTPYVVCTGGEPMLQFDEQLLDCLHLRGFEVGIETNGTLDVPSGIDWICVSPKAKTTCRLTTGDELKFVFPQLSADPRDFEQMDFGRFFLQPMDGPELAENTQRAMQYCMEHPQWELSLQTHKLLGIP